MNIAGCIARMALLLASQVQNSMDDDWTPQDEDTITR
jgi:hypothetical protein